jgi:hypothetical protein
MATPEKQPELSFFCRPLRSAPTSSKIIAEQNFYRTLNRQLAAQVGLAAEET